jgi:hypothetical protein
MNKTIDTLVQDIYNLMETKSSPRGTDVEGIIDQFGEEIKELMRNEFLPSKSYDGRKLRLSSIGKPLRQQWMAFMGFSREKLQPHNYIKFFFGHMIESYVLALAKLAGHEVTEQQKKCEVEGIIGHQDCRIDGVLVDVKSASSYSFGKFQDGSIFNDDPFGYVRQLLAYAEQEGDTEMAWLAMDKQLGKLTLCKFKTTDDPVKDINVREEINSLKKSVQLQDMPEPCATPVPDGKSGNEKLPSICSYCAYKKHCYPDLRVFLYSTGPRFLSTVVNEPKVPEITKEDF